jgi:hypothetical protein
MIKPKASHGDYEGMHPFKNGHGHFEVFWISNNTEGFESCEPGWYWWTCEPGCLPDSEPNGPFNTSYMAWRDAKGLDQ